MLCRTCGRGELEHKWADGCGAFKAGGRMGHDEFNPPEVIQQEFKDPAALTGTTVTRVEGNTKFHKALQKMKEVHDKKSADYANDNRRYSNFEYAAKFAGVTVDQVFAVLIGVKEARLLELESSGKTPLNEAIEDTRLDAAVYAVLRYSYHQ